MQLKAFRLNEYENCSKVLKHFDHFEQYIVTGPDIGILLVQQLRFRI